MDGNLLKKVASVKVFENKNEVKTFGFMVGDREVATAEVEFKHLFGEDNLENCNLRWVVVDDTGSLIVGETKISKDNKAVIRLPNKLFTCARRLKVQLTVTSKDGSKILNLQQFTDLNIVNNLSTNEIVEPVYGVLINDLYDETDKCIESIKEYLLTTPNGGNAEYLRGYAPDDFLKKNHAMSEENIEKLKISKDYKLGDVVSLLGFYFKGDGARHFRILSTVQKFGAVKTANGFWANVLPVDSTLNVAWFGAKGNTDSTQAFLDCFNYANARYSDLTVSKVTANYERYIINKTIHILKALTVDLNQCSLDFETCMDAVGVRIFSSGAVNSYPNLNNLFNSNVSIGGFAVIGLKNGYKGFFTSDITDEKLNETNYLYKKGFTGVLIDNSSVCTFDRIAVSACEKGFDFSTSNTYITTLKSSSARFCKHCIFINYAQNSGVSNSNERMTFTECNFGNSYATLYIKGSGFHFDKCSFDYERYIAAPDTLCLDTSHGGTQNGIGTFTNCWFEDVKSNKEYKFYTDKSVLTFSQCYFIEPSVNYFIKAESENALVTFSQCHFGASGALAPYRVDIDPWQVPKIITKFCTYHKFWSEAGGFKKLQSENMIENGYMQKTDSDFSAWSPNDGLLVDDKRWSYVTNSASKRVIKAVGTQYKGAQICSHMIPVSPGEMITVKVKSTAQNNVMTFFRMDGTPISGFTNIFISVVGDTRYLKPYMVPQGAFILQIKVKSQDNGTDASFELEMMEVLKV
ncbi:MAG: hypothetical protein ACRCZ2_12210 [Fusobacteriaceae bacterium]